MIVVAAAAACHATTITLLQRGDCDAGAGCWACIPGWGASQSHTPNFQLARTGYRDAQLGPKVNKQLFREHIDRELTSLTILTFFVEMC